MNTGNEKSPEVLKYKPYKVRLPGFVVEDDIGLGDLIKKATYAMGIKTCDGCEKRAAVPNNWMRITR